MKQQRYLSLLSSALLGPILVAGFGSVTDATAQTAPVATATLPVKLHLLPATMETTQWGWFDNAQAPVLTVRAGDTIVMETMTHFHDKFVPGFTLEQLAKIRADNPGRGAHSVTGPIYVAGAEPGDVLKIRLNKIVPRAYGLNMNIPGFAGQFPKEFPEGSSSFISIGTGRSPNSCPAYSFHCGHFPAYWASPEQNLAAIIPFRPDATRAISTFAS